MTLEQAAHALGHDPAPEGGPRKSDADKAKARAAVFDAICRSHGLDPHTLATIPPERVRDLIVEQGEPVPLNAPVASWVTEYLANAP